MGEQQEKQGIKGMTPSKAIRLECKWCMGAVKGFTCGIKECKLNRKSLTPLKRIRLHCLDCVETRQEVRDCTGKLLHEDRLCYLHQYRLGHNPKRKGVGDAKNFKKTLTHNRVSGSKNDSDYLIRV